VATITSEMILLSVKSGIDAAGRLYESDDKVDALYRNLNEAIYTPTEPQNQKRTPEPRRYISALLILRNLDVFQIMSIMSIMWKTLHYVITGTTRRDANCRIEQQYDIKINKDLKRRLL
jgi:phosphate uptake regulator